MLFLTRIAPPSKLRSSDRQGRRSDPHIEELHQGGFPTRLALPQHGSASRWGTHGSPVPVSPFLVISVVRPTDRKGPTDETIAHGPRSRPGARVPRWGDRPGRFHAPDNPQL